MNQHGNEPMTILHVRIPCDLLERITILAEQSGISKSEYVRHALDHVMSRGFIIEKSVRFCSDTDNKMLL